MRLDARLVALACGVVSVCGGAAVGRAPIEVIGPLPSPFTTVIWLNDCADPDCQVLMMTLQRGAAPREHAFRWSSADGFTDLSSAAGLDTMDFALESADGSSYLCDLPGQGLLYHWVPPAAPVLIDFPVGTNYRMAQAISADGGAVAGVFSVQPSGSGARGYIWTSDTGVVDMNLPSPTSWPSVGWISADGSTVIGDSQNGSVWSAFRWQAGNLTFLPGVNGGPATDVIASPDGQTIVGRGNGNRMTVWRNDVPTEYGASPSPYNGFEPFGVSADGGTVVGWMYNTSTGGTKGFIWKKNTGFREAAPYLVQLGVTMPGWDIREVSDISHDGRTVIGRGNGGLFRVQNVIPPACEGDFDGDGDVDTADLAELLGGFGACPASANYKIHLNMSGADPCINTADLVSMLGVFGSSCN